MPKPHLDPSDVGASSHEAGRTSVAKHMGYDIGVVSQSNLRFCRVPDRPEPLLVDVSERSVQSTILRGNCFESSIGEREGPALSGLRDPEGSSFCMDSVPSQANRLTETSSCIDKKDAESMI